MWFAILGPVEVTRDGVPVPVARPRHRAVLAYLLLNHNRVVSPEQIAEAIWAGAPPSTARRQLHNIVSALRRDLAAVPGHGAGIETTPSGYVHSVEAGQLDLAVFGEQVATARRATASSDWQLAARHLRGALNLWRGPALGGVTAAYTDRVRVSLDDERVQALELLIDAELAMGHHDAVVGELYQLALQFPLRERVATQLMLALYRSDRRPDALQVARDLQYRLKQELGLDPGEAVADLERAILRADPGLDWTEHALDVIRPRPAEQPLATGPAQLPLDVGGFTGRDDQLRQLDLLLANPVTQPTALKVCVITGTAGVGKTALAVHWAHRATGGFPDGTLYANLRGFDPAGTPAESVEVLRRFLRGLGVSPDAIPTERDEAAALYRSRLSGKRMLVILDNAYDAEQVRPLLPGSPACLALITSRNRLTGLVASDGARLLDLPTMTPEQSVELLNAVLGPAVTGAREAVGRLAQRCAHLPLALRIAAANIACDPSRTIVSFTAELEQGDKLSVLSTVGDERSAVRVAFGLSYQSLAKPLQRLFRMLHAIPGEDFGAEAVAAMLDTTSGQAYQMLRKLRDAHLISAHQAGRYTMHDLLRSYAHSQAMKDETPAALSQANRRLVDFYSLTLYDAYPFLSTRRTDAERDLEHPPIEQLIFHDRESVLQWHDLERDNILGVIRLAAARGWHRPAWHLADTVYAYYSTRRHWPDWLTALNIGLSSARALGDREAEARMHNALGVVSKQTGRYSDARRHYMLALDAASEIGHSRLVAGFHVNLGGLSINEGDYESGVLHLKEALTHPDYGCDPEFATATFNNYGCALLELSRIDEAKEAMTRSLAFAAEVDDLVHLCHTNAGLAEIALLEGDPATALSHVTQQIEAAGRLGDPLLQAFGLDLLGSCLADSDPAAAMDRWRVAYAGYREIDHRLQAHLREWLDSLQAGIDTESLAHLDKERRRVARLML